MSADSAALKIVTSYNEPRVVHKNIVKVEVEAIVNSANSSLMSGSGVCGAIHYAAGPDLEKECATIGHCDVGSAVITKGYKLKCKFVIHAVGPVYYHNRAKAPELLKSAYEASLRIAHDQGIKTLAFPCISTGVYGYPKLEAAQIAVATVRDFLATHGNIEVLFCCYDSEDYEIYKALLS